MTNLKDKELTLREIEVIKLIKKGYTSDEIAEKLFLSKSTISTHRYRINKKLSVKNVAKLLTKVDKLNILKS